MMFACQFDNNLFALPLFQGICNSKSNNESISLQRATLGDGLQNRTPTTSGARSWYKMIFFYIVFLMSRVLHQWFLNSFAYFPIINI
jgi:hypothetical protein